MKPGDYSANAHFYLAAYTLRNPWVLWLVSRGGLQDYRARRPGVGDVLDPETLKLLPKPVVLEREATHP